MIFVSSKPRWVVACELLTLAGTTGKNLVSALQALLVEKDGVDHLIAWAGTVDEVTRKFVMSHVTLVTEGGQTKIKLRETQQ